ncbi:MAG: hypothetical protein ACYC6A_10365 [Armatimonadota bacterium]
MGRQDLFGGRDYLQLSIGTLRDISDPAWIEMFVGLLEHYGFNRFSYYAPGHEAKWHYAGRRIVGLKQLWSGTSFQDIEMPNGRRGSHSIHVDGKGSNYEWNGVAGWSMPNISNTNNILLNVTWPFIESDEHKKNVILLFTELCERSEAVYGAIADVDALNNVWITEGLPGIFWVNMFGKPIVDVLGQEKLLSLPVYYKRVLGSGGILLVVKETPWHSINRRYAIQPQRLPSGEFLAQSPEWPGLSATDSQVFTAIEKAKQQIEDAILARSKRELPFVWEISEAIGEAYFGPQAARKVVQQPNQLTADDDRVWNDPEAFIEQHEELTAAFGRRFSPALESKPDSLGVIDGWLAAKARNREVLTNEEVRQLTAFFGNVIIHSYPECFWGVFKVSYKQHEPMSERAVVILPNKEQIVPRDEVVKAWIGGEPLVQVHARILRQPPETAPVKQPSAKRTQPATAPEAQPRRP